MLFKKIKKQKRALIYNIVLVLIAFAALVSALIIIGNKAEELDDKMIGERQSEIINEYQKADKVLYFVDKLGEYSAYESIPQMNKQGGFSENSENSDCERFNDINLWTKADEEDNRKAVECYPINEKGKFVGDFDKFYDPELNKLLKHYSFKVVSREMNVNEVNSTISGQRIKIDSIANEPIVINLEEKETEKGEYSYNPSFSLIMDYNFNDYRNATKFSKKVIEKCSKVNDVKECVEGISKEEFNEKIEISTCEGEHKELSDDFYKDRMINFCFRSDKKMLYADNLDIDFAIFIPDKAAPPEIKSLELVPGKNYVEISWEDIKKEGSYDAKDVEKYHIYRTYGKFFTNTKTTKYVGKVPKGINEYIDSPLIEGIYYYAVVAEDRFGNKLETFNKEDINKVVKRVTVIE